MHNAFEDRSGKGRSHDPPGRPPEPSCPNCGHPDPARYCPSCGQSQRDPRRSVAHLARDVLAEELALGARTPRTLRTLLLRPGRLTLDWIRGRRARYLGAFRLYLITVAVFFAVTFFLGFPVGRELSLERLVSRPEVPIGVEVSAIARRAMAGRLQTVLTLGAFLIVPVFALWLTFLRRKNTDRVFADHLVFSLHQHTVLLLLATVAWPLFFLEPAGVVVGFVLLAGAGVHTLLAYRRVYRAPRWWLRFLPVAGGWGVAFLSALVFGAAEFGSMVTAEYDPARRFHALRLWDEAHGELHPSGDTAAIRTLRELALSAYREVGEPYLLEWDAYRIADLQVELGKPDEALERIEGFLAEHPDHPLPLGLASLAAARAGDSALARERARRFLTRAEADPPPGDSWFYPRFVAFRDHARRLLDSRSPEARSP